ncbi:hypothetical protein [Cupriavidus alkaliphilus]|uniref:Uncharacterized protein n=1 Tax=Cupriavidus alkaliphilus TaxID=942866 RepID=A0A7W4VBI0_9BURK|nr:hypothetical protein [Cupriavidus alkaliphilus]MBB3008572.1 hypothetical protein [Cupriavidus alkaliphilus]
MLRVLGAGHATERRAAAQPGSGRVAGLHVRQRRLVDGRHGEAPRIFFVLSANSRRHCGNAMLIAMRRAMA